VFAAKYQAKHYGLNPLEVLWGLVYRNIALRPLINWPDKFIITMEWVLVDMYNERLSEIAQKHPQLAEPIYEWCANCGKPFSNPNIPFDVCMCERE